MKKREDREHLFLFDPDIHPYVETVIIMSADRIDLLLLIIGETGVSNYYTTDENKNNDIFCVE